MINTLTYKVGTALPDKTRRIQGREGSLYITPDGQFFFKPSGKNDILVQLARKDYSDSEDAKLQKQITDNLKTLTDHITATNKRLDTLETQATDFEKRISALENPTK